MDLRHPAARYERGLAKARNPVTTSNKRPPRTAGAVTLGFEMAVPIAIFGWIGYRVDAWQGTAPWCLLGGCGLGLMVAFYSLWKYVRVAKDEESGR